ncbi:hypothetical protein VNO77_23342 [Canavalia gladiata]|uniref:Uncharacterized protein n=1 Tax=Canavalia gladiata TaxID=3824 RepID=A0AAN9QBM0_CANGL
MFLSCLVKLERPGGNGYDFKFKDASLSLPDHGFCYPFFLLTSSNDRGTGTMQDHTGMGQLLLILGLTLHRSVPSSSSLVVACTVHISLGPHIFLHQPIEGFLLAIYIDLLYDQGVLKINEKEICWR